MGPLLAPVSAAPPSRACEFFITSSMVNVGKHYRRKIIILGVMMTIREKDNRQ